MVTLKIPRIARAPGGNVKIDLGDGRTVTCVDISTTTEDIGIRPDHPQFEVFKHLFEILAEKGKTLEDAADSGVFRDLLDRYDITMSERKVV